MFRHATRLISCILLISVLFMFSACGRPADVDVPADTAAPDTDPPRTLSGITVTDNRESYGFGEEPDLTVTAGYSDGTPSRLWQRVWRSITKLTSKVSGTL